MFVNVLVDIFMLLYICFTFSPVCMIVGQTENPIHTGYSKAIFFFDGT